METKYSALSKLIELEEVINTRTPVWDIGGSGDVRIKLDTDVNGQEWYVIQDDSRHCGCFNGIASCWAFPHFNGAHDFYRYIPIAYCFKTFAELLIAHPTEWAMWAYDVEEYEQRREQQAQSALMERSQSWGLDRSEPQWDKLNTTVPTSSNNVIGFRKTHD